MPPPPLLPIQVLVAVDNVNNNGRLPFRSWKKRISRAVLSRCIMIYRLNSIVLGPAIRAESSAWAWIYYLVGKKNSQHQVSVLFLRLEVCYNVDKCGDNRSCRWWRAHRVRWVGIVSIVFYFWPPLEGWIVFEHSFKKPGRADIFTVSMCSYLERKAEFISLCVCLCGCLCMEGSGFLSACLSGCMCAHFCRNWAGFLSVCVRSRIILFIG